MLLTIIGTILLSIPTYFLLFVPFPKGWKSTLSYRLLCIVLVNITRFQELVVYCLEQCGFKKKEKILRFFHNSKKLYCMKGIDVSIRCCKGVQVIVFKHKDKKLLSGRGILYFHDGLVDGNVEGVSRFLCNMAKHTDAVVVSPRYRKAPEHPFPAAFEDCYAVTTGFIAQATDFGVESNRIALSGDGGGGNLAAAVSHKLCNEETSIGKPALVYLVTPILQFAVYNLPSQLENKQDPMLKSEQLNYTKVCYLGYADKTRVSSAMEDHGHLITSGGLDKDIVRYVDGSHLPERFRNDTIKRWAPLSTIVKNSKRLGNRERRSIQELVANPLLSPLYATDDELKKLPTTYVLTCGCDVLRDDGALYYERLRKVRTDVNLIHLENTPHGFIGLTKYSTGWTIDEEAEETVFNYFKVLKYF